MEYKKLPADLFYYGASDHAVSDAGGDFSEHGVCGVDAADNLYVVDWWWGRHSLNVVTEAMLDKIERWSPMAWAVEKGPIWRAASPYVKKRMDEREVWGHIVEYPSTQNKEIRAQSFQGRMAQGKVWFPKHAPWVGRLIDQMMKFPNGKFDDGVDVLSLMGRMLADMVGKKPEKPKDPPKFENEFKLGNPWDEDDGLE